MIPPEKCLQLYIAMKLHFTNESYDAVEHQCRVKGIYNVAYLKKRHDASLIAAMAKKMDSAAICASYMAANAAYGNMYPFDDFEKSDTLYVRWKRIRQSMTKVFQDDLNTIASHDVSYKELIDPSEGLPKLFQLAKANYITAETVVVLNKYDNFIGKWKSNYPLWKAEMLRIGKLDNFVKFDPLKIEPIIATFKEELGTENA